MDSDSQLAAGPDEAMATALQQALAHDQLQLLYQPLVDLRTGAVASVEALVRWQHPLRGLLAAQQFIPAADAAGLSAAIGDWVLRRSCEDRLLWRGDTPTGGKLQLAVNVSARQLHDPRFGPSVAALLDQHGLAPAALTLELSETTLMQDPAASASALAWFKQLGVVLTLDDFGTGHACLSNLKRFPFDFLKIDGEFVRDLVGNAGDAALTRAIIGMAHNMGMRVVAEGVETEAQCDFLRKHMCDLIQGYFYAPPLTPAETGALLAEDRRLPPHLLRTQKKRRRLLLVDDEVNIVSALKRLLRPDGYDILTAHSGEAGLEVLRQQAVDVILSDQRMPGMIGADFLRQARLLHPETIRIMLSGYTELQSVTDAVNEGAIYKFLTKPWNDDQLRAHLAEAFRLKEIADENERLHIEVRTANNELASANRRMEQLLRQMERQIHRDGISLGIAREILQHLPLPVIGMDDEGMIAFINGAAGRVFQGGAALLGNAAGEVLPQLFPLDQAAPAGHQADIGGQRYAVMVYPMGGHSASRGSLITLSRCGDAP